MYTAHSSRTEAQDLQESASLHQQGRLEPSQSRGECQRMEKYGETWRRQRILRMKQRNAIILQDITRIAFISPG